jgi:hypothetical protein
MRFKLTTSYVCFVFPLAGCQQLPLVDAPAAGRGHYQSSPESARTAMAVQRQSAFTDGTKPAVIGAIQQAKAPSTQARCRYTGFPEHWRRPKDARGCAGAPLIEAVTPLPGNDQRQLAQNATPMVQGIATAPEAGQCRHCGHSQSAVRSDNRACRRALALTESPPKRLAPHLWYPPTHRRSPRTR